MNHNEGQLGESQFGEPLYKDVAEKIKLEARNGLLLLEYVMAAIDAGG